MKNLHDPTVKLKGMFIPLFYARHASDFGIGDFKSLELALQLGHRCGANLMEILPITWSAAFNSPYSVLSSICIDPIYLDIHQLLKCWVPKKEALILKTHEEQRSILWNQKKVDYPSVRALKFRIYTELFNSLNKAVHWRKEESFETFLVQNPDMEDHLLFIILREHYIKENPASGWDFRSWPESVKRRSPAVLNTLKVQYRDQLDFHLFLQWQIKTQWEGVQKVASDLNMHIMGDIPFSVEGADVWMNPSLFNLNPKDLKRAYSLGVPPDVYSDTGQYWQFYAYDWQHPDIKPFMLKRIQWNFRFFSVVRMDHVLGFYRSYWYYEDPLKTCTLRALKLEGKALAYREKGLQDPNRQGELAWKFYQILTSHLKAREALFKTEWLEDKKNTLKPDHMLIVAREVARGQTLHHLYTRQFSVEKAVYEKDNPELDFMRLSDQKAFQNHERVCSYLFDLERAPKGNDSFRPCFFMSAPGEDFLKEILSFSKEHQRLLVFETLGVVPDSIRESVKTLGAVDYFPMIYGMDPLDLHNPYRKENHSESGLATFALHDSLSIKPWWQDLSEQKKSEILVYLGMDPSTQDLNTVGCAIQNAILKEVMSSKARAKVILISDLTLDDRDSGINVPGKHSSNWEARLGKDLSLDQLLILSKHTEQRSHMGSHTGPQNNLPALNLIALIKDLMT